MKNYSLLVIMLLLLTPKLSLSQRADTHALRPYFDDTIMQRTALSGDHHTLLAAVQVAELDETLNGDAHYTVFAPSDTAFKKLSSETMAYLFRPENKAELQSLLTYHMVAGRLSATRILKEMSRGGGKAQFTTVEGSKLVATLDGIDIVLTDQFGNEARITSADEDRCNGIVHVIDSVVLPKKM